MKCAHDRRRIIWWDQDAGSYEEAVLTPNETWIHVLPNKIQRLTECPGCGVELWGLPHKERRATPGEAHTGRRRPAYDERHPFIPSKPGKPACVVLRVSDPGGRRR